MKIHLYYILILAVFFGLTPVSLAQPEVIKSAHNDLVGSLDKLSEVKESPLSQEEKERQELELKKSALEKAVNLSLLETKNFSDILGSLEAADMEPELLALRDIFLNNLAEYLKHFSVVSNSLAESNDLASLQKLAGGFNDWRAGTYNPEIKKIFDFILVFETKALIKTAYARFLKTVSDLEKLQSVSLKELLWSRFLNAAVLKVRLAQDSNSQALALLTAYLPPSGVKDGKFTAQVLEAEKVRASSEEPAPNSPPTVRELVINSLNKLKEAYESFIEISSITKVLR